MGPGARAIGVPVPDEPRAPAAWAIAELCAPALREARYDESACFALAPNYLQPSSAEVALREGRVGKLKLQTPAMIRFGQMTEDEVFVSAKAAKEGVIFENTGSEPLVGLRYFGPDAQPNAPGVCDWERALSKCNSQPRP